MDSYRGDGLNLYAYVANNPINFIDLSSYCKEESNIRHEFLDLNKLTPGTRELSMFYVEGMQKTANGDMDYGSLAPMDYQTYEALYDI